MADQVRTWQGIRREWDLQSQWIQAPLRHVMPSMTEGSRSNQALSLTPYAFPGSVSQEVSKERELGLRPSLFAVAARWAPWTEPSRSLGPPEAGRWAPGA